MGMYIGGQKISPIIKVGEINNQDKTITENGTYTADAGYTGLGEVTINVPSEQPVITGLNVAPTTSTQTIVAPSGTDGYSPVNVGAVTSSIDANIIAGNIKKDVSILGVTGILEEGITPTGTISITENGTVDVTNYANAEVNVSGGSGSTTGFLVQVIDYDGIVLKQDHLDTGATFTLPSQPSHTGLTFQSWSSPVTITNNTVTVADSDITIGATYTTASGLSEFDITLTSATGLSVTLNMNGTKDWGDGTSDTSTTHTYVSAGDYTITCDGSTMTTSASSGLFGQTSSNINYYVKNMRLGSSVTGIGNSAFNRCCSLTSITIPEGVTSIGDVAFLGCYSLTSITIPEGVTSIGDSAFEYCYSLTSITIPSSITSISTYMFSSCFSLTSITIPEGVTSIGDRAFNRCCSLTSITIPEGVTSIGDSAFEGCYSLTSITIPEGVTSIGDRAFQDCCSLTSITIPEGVTSIGNSAFQDCYSLTSITIPSSVTSISTYMFSSCFPLTSITIPEGVTSIGDRAFQDCRSILEYDFSKHTTIPTLSAFESINRICKIYVPWDLYESWKSATNWSTYADYITHKNPATLNFTISPSGNSIVYVNSKQIQGTSTSWIGSSASYIVHDTINNVVLPGTQTGIIEGSTVDITADLTTSNKITLSTGVTGLTAKFTVGGVTFNATDEGSGNYSINVAGSETTVDYFIDGGSDYVDVRGSITATGSDTTEAVTLTPAAEVSFVRPNLTANGIIGGDSFAVKSTNTTNSYPAYLAFDSNSNSYMLVNSVDGTELTIYSPDSLKVSTIVIKYSSKSTSYQADVIKVQGSKDNSTWADLVETKYVSGITRTLDVNSNTFYSYYRLIMTCNVYIRISDITINATYKVPAA